MDKVGFELKNIKDIIQLKISLTKTLPNLIFIIVSSTPSIFGMIRMWETLSSMKDGFSWVVKTFNNLDKCETWINHNMVSS